MTTPENEPYLDATLGEPATEAAAPEPSAPCEPLPRMTIVSPEGAERPLFGHEAPSVRYKKEGARHRAIALLKASGMDNKEIAEQLGITAQTVMQVCQQPYAQAVIVDEIRRAGRDAIQETFVNAMPQAVDKLIELCGSADSQETQRKAANDLINRVYGMPRESILHETKQADIEQMSDAELHKLVQEGMARRGN